MKLRRLALLFFFLLSVISSQQVLAASNLDEGVSQLARQIGKSMEERQSQKIAIIDFSDLNGNVSALGQFLAEELTTQLFIVAPGKFEVVERRQLMKLEEELMLGMSGFIEDKSIKKMGQVLGVDAIVTGSMTDLGNTVKINARLIEVESARVFAVAATDIPKTGMVADLIARQTGTKQQAIKPGTEPDKAQHPKTTGDFFGVVKDLNYRVVVTDIKKVSNKFVNIQVEYENLTAQDRTLIFWDYTARNYAMLSDELGNEFKITGDKIGSIDIPKKGKKTINLRFKPDDVVEIGNIFVLNLKSFDENITFVDLRPLQ